MNLRRVRYTLFTRSSRSLWYLFAGIACLSGLVLLLSVWLSASAAGGHQGPQARPPQVPLTSNDDFDAATAITTLPYTDTQDLTDYTLAADDPLLACAAGDRGAHSAWYVYVSPTDARLAVDTLGSEVDAVLAVYTGTRGALTLLACNDDAHGEQAQLRGLDVAQGTTYYFEAATYDAASTGSWCCT